MHWNVGQVKITKVVELEAVGGTRSILPLATAEEIQHEHVHGAHGHHHGDDEGAGDSEPGDHFRSQPLH